MWVITAHISFKGSLHFEQSFEGLLIRVMLVTYFTARIETLFTILDSLKQFSLY